MRHPTMGQKPYGEGMFGDWLVRNVLEQNWTISDLAEKVKMTRQCVVGHMHMYTKPSFPAVCGYCYAFGMRDDPEDIWKLVKEDWG